MMANVGEGAVFSPPKAKVTRSNHVGCATCTILHDVVANGRANAASGRRRCTRNLLAAAGRTNQFTDVRARVAPSVKAYGSTSRPFVHSGAASC